MPTRTATDEMVAEKKLTGFVSGLDGDGFVRLARVVDGERDLDVGPLSSAEARGVAALLVEMADKADARLS